MQFIKVLLWVLFLVAGFIFWWTNEARSSLDVGMAIVEARTSTFTLGALLIGFLPTWLILRGNRWRLTRRIKSLEAAALPAPTSSSTQSSTQATADLNKEQTSKPPVAPTAVKANETKAKEPESVIPPVTDNKVP